MSLDTFAVYTIGRHVIGYAYWTGFTLDAMLNAVLLWEAIPGMRFAAISCRDDPPSEVQEKIRGAGFRLILHGRGKMAGGWSAWVLVSQGYAMDVCICMPQLALYAAAGFECASKTLT